jgi:hypothetical protein
MEHPEITHLYKYRAYNTHSLCILINRKVWFAKPGSFNDPFDCKIPFDHRLTPEAAVSYGRKVGTHEKNINAIFNSKGEIQKGFMEEWGKTLKASDKELEKMGVFTLSESSNNILLWSHYADGHRGFCVEFIRNPDNQLGNYEITRRVQYRDDYPIINPIKEDVFDLKFFTKASDWEYEREWRLVNEEGDSEESLPDVDISAIIFGLKMAESHKKIIRKITSDLTHIKYRQTVIVPDRLELEIEDV